MATMIQVVFDCVDPDRLAKFWAAALHYELQDPPAGYGSWQEFLKASGVPEAEWNSASAIVDPDGKGPRLYFPQMDTPKLGTNRLHVHVNAIGGLRATREGRRRQVNSAVTPRVGLWSK